MQIKGCLFVVFYSLSHVLLFLTPWTVPARLLSPCDSPGKNTGVGFHFLEEVPGMPPVAAQGGKQGLDREKPSA